MTRFGGARVAIAVAVVALTAIALTAVVIRDDHDDETVAAAAAASRAVGPARHTGPQGGFGQFVVQCLYSHSATDDPIVHPRHPGMSHRHDFYGATRANARSSAMAQSIVRSSADPNA